MLQRDLLQKERSSCAPASHGTTRLAQQSLHSFVALPSEELPSEELPSEELPSEELPSQSLPSQVLPSWMLLCVGAYLPEAGGSVPNGSARAISDALSESRALLEAGDSAQCASGCEVALSANQRFAVGWPWLFQQLER